MTGKISTNHNEVKAQYPKLYIRPVNEDENKPCWGKKSTESKSVKFGFDKKTLTRPCTPQVTHLHSQTPK
jgi:hypothetical protein